MKARQRFLRFFHQVNAVSVQGMPSTLQKASVLFSGLKCDCQPIPLAPRGLHRRLVLTYVAPCSEWHLS